MPELVHHLVREGRKEFMKQWRSIRDQANARGLPIPCSSETFERCKLDHSERREAREILRLYRDLIPLRRNRSDIRATVRKRRSMEPCSAGSIRAALFCADGADRLLIVNLGQQTWSLIRAPSRCSRRRRACVERLAFPPKHPRYGGSGRGHMEAKDLSWIDTRARCGAALP